MPKKLFKSKLALCRRCQNHYWTAPGLKKYCSSKCRTLGPKRTTPVTTMKDIGAGRPPVNVYFQVVNRDRVEYLETKVRELESAQRRRPASPSTNFYRSMAWRRLRYNFLRTSERICVCCGYRGGRLHVDHIKPRSKYPHLQLDPRNLQLLCEDCNLGKSNRDETNWREASM